MKSIYGLKVAKNGKVYGRVLPLRTKKSVTGYKYVTFTYKGKTMRRFVHRLVALCYVKGKTKQKRIVNHKDGNKLNNDYKNLEWCTVKYNFTHAKKMGLIPKNARNRYK